jgi:UDP-N-acetylglucosamine 2-epimerase (non-hydrolysing)
MRVLVVIGTRPEAIKMAPIVYALREHPGLQPVVCLTAQHRDMLDDVIRVFDLPVDHDLDLMKPGQTLTHVAIEVLRGIDRILDTSSIDWVLVQGDTTTSLAAAQAAFHRRVPVGHVEAGLRTWNRFEPFPEEWNRCAIDALADLAFAPTEQAAENLRVERFPESRILVTGNTSIDALRIALERPAPPPPPGLEELAADRPMVLVTAHRRESFGKPLDDVCRALAELAGRANGSGISVVYPVHPNPNVRASVARHLDGRPHVHLLPPVSYHQFVHLMRRAHLILTDSGGIQEEAPGLHKPVLVLRDRTERPEAVAAGTARIVGTDPERIRSAVDRLLGDPSAYASMATAVNPFGDGYAAERIANALVEHRPAAGAAS